MLWGVAAMIAVILLIDQLIWRPRLHGRRNSDSNRWRASQAPTSPILHILRNSQPNSFLNEKTDSSTCRKTRLMLREAKKPCLGPRTGDTGNPRSWQRESLGWLQSATESVEVVLLLRGDRPP